MVKHRSVRWRGGCFSRAIGVAAGRDQQYEVDRFDTTSLNYMFNPH